MRKRFKLHLPGDEERLESAAIDFPNFAVEALVVVVVELFVLEHPVPKLLELQPAGLDVDVVALEDADGELFHHMMNVNGRDFHIVLSDLYLECCALRVVSTAHLLQ